MMKRSTEGSGAPDKRSKNSQGGSVGEYRLSSVSEDGLCRAGVDADKSRGDLGAQSAPTTPLHAAHSAPTPPPTPMSVQRHPAQYDVKQWLPCVVQFLSFRDLTAVCNVSKTWRNVALSFSDPRVFARHLATAINRNQKLNGRATGEGSDKFRIHAHDYSQAVCNACAGDTQLLYGLRLMWELSNISRRSPTGDNYASFLKALNPVSRAHTALSCHLPKMLKGFYEAVAKHFDLAILWDVNTTTLPEAADFALSAVCAVSKSLEVLFKNPAGNKVVDPTTPQLTQQGSSPEMKIKLLRVEFKRGLEYGVFMDPVLNTVHVSSLDTEFLVEQLHNAIRSLSRLNGLCGICSDAKEVEERVSSLLGLSGVRRDKKIGESEHAHCLFKLALYWKEVNNELKGMVVEPSNEFAKMSAPDGRCIAKFIWSASWTGSNAPKTAAEGQHANGGDNENDEEDEEEEEEDDDDSEVGLDELYDDYDGLDEDSGGEDGEDVAMTDASGSDLGDPFDQGE